MSAGKHENRAWPRRVTVMASWAFCAGLLTIAASCDGPAPAPPVAAPNPDPEPNPTPEGPAKSNTDTSTSDTSTAGKPGQVLRHAVFFKFKETSTDEQVTEVVDAFRALPGKIESIIDFAWGVNNSPEELNDGLTHCFLLTFKDAAGRAEYLPHPAHKEFGDVLRPHMERVFVIDYWGTPPQSKLEKELKHFVFFKFKKDAAATEVEKIEEGFAALPGKIEAIKAFEWGRNNSPERHDNGFTHAFLVTFDSEEGRAAYLPHPEHEAFVKQLKPILEEARVLDFWAQQ